MRIDYRLPAQGWHSPADPGIHFRPLQPAADAAWLHTWFVQPQAHFWGMQQHSRAEVQAFYQQLCSSGHALAAVGECEGRAAFLLECYDPRHDVLGAHVDVQPGDVGMHFFVGPAEQPVHGFTRRVFRALMQLLFDHLGAQRVVVEPDIRNHKVHVLNAAMGFEVHGPLQLPHKTALLSTCTRAQFQRATARLANPSPSLTEDLSA